MGEGQEDREKKGSQEAEQSVEELRERSGWMVAPKRKESEEEERRGQVFISSSSQKCKLTSE